MYHALLTNRYLTSHVIPLIAVAAVALCVTLVITVVSVMTGFLNMVKDSGRTLIGDVVITYPVSGIPHYEELISRIMKLPEAQAAAPVVESWGLLRMPYPAGPDKLTETVQVWGVDHRFTQVTGFEDILYWRPESKDELAKMLDDDPRRWINKPSEDGGPTTAEKLLRDGLALHNEASDKEGIVLGMHVSSANERTKDGSYRQMGQGMWWMPGFEVTLTVLPIDIAGGMLDPESHIFTIVNEFVSGVYLIDDKRVIIPIERAQEMVHFAQGERVNPDELDEMGLPKVIGIDPARATMVLVRAKDGYTPTQLRDAVANEYRLMWEEMIGQSPTPVMPPSPERITILTWEQQQSEFIGPIEKERELMRVLFSLIYIVCAGLVLAIFWSIVYDKTRDIGILRSVGATRSGILWIFLRYGLIIGVLGSIGGLGLAYLIVHNINFIHNAIGQPASTTIKIIAFSLAGLAVALTIFKALSGRLLPLVLCMLLSVTLLLIAVGLLFHHGTTIWDPSVYYFSVIPNRMDMSTAIITMIGAVFFSLLGAFIPAARAADIDPVRALRYE